MQSGYGSGKAEYAQGQPLESGVCFGGTGTNLVIPLAGFVSGIGGIATALSPYMGVYGLGATLAGNLMQGYGSAVLAGYQNISGRILANADTIMTNKVRNIETVAKMLDTQGDIVRKMLKDSIESDSKAIQDMG